MPDTLTPPQPTPVPVPIAPAENTPIDDFTDTALYADLSYEGDPEVRAWM